jgi:hypothetical protein
LLNNVEDSLGSQTNIGQSEYNNQFVYSNFRSLEGIGIFNAILDAHGWQAYKIIKENINWSVPK